MWADLKIGLEFISAFGPDGIRAIVALGRPVFADVKFHDIPNTVAGAATALATLGAAILNVHASGGEEMMRAAVKAVSGASPRPKIVGVTVLTSLDDAVSKRWDNKRPHLTRSFDLRGSQRSRGWTASFAVRTKSGWSGQPAVLNS